MCTSDRPTAQQIIDYLGMKSLPHEGPWFVETYRSADVITGGSMDARYSGNRVASTGIYALITQQAFSAMHLLATDEMWHFYGGDPLEMLLLYPGGRGEIITLGADLLHGQHPQYLVPRGVWQGSRPRGGNNAFSLIGNTLSPGFEFADYTPGYRDELQKAWPLFADTIAELTRTDSIRPPQTTPPSSMPSPDVLRELVGRHSALKSERLSVAWIRHFTGEPEIVRRNHISEEVIVILAGHAELHLGGQIYPAASGVALHIPPGTVYRIRSTGAQPLEAYAICSPAFAMEQHELLKT